MSPPFRMPHRPSAIGRLRYDTPVFQFTIYKKIGFLNLVPVGIGYGIYA